MRLFSNVWIENTALFERLMRNPFQFNSPKLYYGFNNTITMISPTNVYSISSQNAIFNTLNLKKAVHKSHMVIISTIHGHSVFHKKKKILKTEWFLTSQNKIRVISWRHHKNKSNGYGYGNAIHCKIYAYPEACSL